MTDSEPTEHRRTQRVAHAFLIRYQPPRAGKPTWLSSPLRDLSSGGARFVSEHHFETGAIFDAQLLLPLSQQPVFVKVRVAWVKPWRAGLVEVGVTFDANDMAIQQAIDESVERLIHKKPSPEE
jgi:Tfp pilus assembly protein PilZ